MVCLVSEGGHAVPRQDLAGSGPLHAAAHLSLMWLAAAHAPAALCLMRQRGVPAPLVVILKLKGLLSVDAQLHAPGGKDQSVF